MLLFQPAVAQTWTGGTDANWGESSNWDNNAVPGGVDTVTIAGAGGANQPTINALEVFAAAGTNVSAGTLTIGGTLTSPVTLSGTGNLVINGGGQVVGAVAAGGASGSNSGTITGALTVSAGTFTNGGVVTGATTLNGGTLTLAAGSNLADGAALIVNGGTLNLNGVTETVGSLSGTGGAIAIGTNGRLNVTQTADATYAGNISGSVSAPDTVYFEKLGASTLTLTGSDTVSGAGRFEITAGRVAVSGGNAIADTGVIGMSAGASLELLANQTETVGALAAAPGASIILNAGSTLTVGGVGYSTGSTGNAPSISGAGNLVLNAPGLTQGFGAALAYTGTTTITSGTFLYTAGGIIADASLVTVNGGVLDIATFSDTVAGVSLQSGSIAGTTGVLTSASDFDVRSGSVSAILGGAVGLTKTTGGTVTLTGVNTYSGVTTVSGGTLAVTGSGTLGSNTSVTIGPNATLSTDGGALGSGVTIQNDGTFALTGGGSESIASISNTGSSNPGAITLSAGSVLTLNAGVSAISGVISGDGGLSVTGTSDTTLTGANSYAGPTTITDVVLKVGNGGTTGTLGTGTVDLATATSQISFDRSDELTVVNVFTGVADSQIKQIGPGTTIITGTSSAFAGTTNVNAGILRVNGTLGSAASILNVIAGGTLQGSGTIGGNVNIDGTLAPGASPGTLTIGGNLVLSAGSNTVFEFGAASVVGGTSNDRVIVLGDLTLGGTLTSDPSNGDGYYRLFDYGGTLLSSSFDTVTSSQTAQVLTNVAGQVNLALGAVGAVQYWQGTDMVGDVSSSGGSGVDTGGPGTWSATNTNWSTAPGFGINDQWKAQTAVFAGAAGGTVLVDGAQIFQQINFTTDGYTLNDGVAGSLQTTGGFSVIDVATGLTASINVPITGGGGLSKSGDGVLQLGGLSTYAGFTEITAGTLRTMVVNALPINTAMTILAPGTFDLNGFSQTIGSLAGAAGSSVTLGSATLTTGGNNSSTTFSGVISGSGGLMKTGTGVFTLAGANTYSGATTVSNGTLQAGVAGALPSGTAVSVGMTGVLDLNSFNQIIGSLAGAVGSSVTLGSATLTTGGDNSSTSFDGVISGTGGLTKVGAGTFTLTGVNSYSGTTSVQGGTLSNTGTLAGPVVNTATVLNSGIVNGTVNNQASFTNTAGATTGAFTNSGTASNAGVVASLNNAAGSFGNAGTIAGGAVVTGGVLTTSGTVNGGLSNAATTNASGTISGGVSNTGAFTVAGALSNSGNDFANSGAGTLRFAGAQAFTNIGTLTNTASGAGAVIVSAGATLSAVTINNLVGGFSNTGTITAASLVNGGTFTSSGALNVTTAFTNGGIFNGAGSVNAATISNSGLFNVAGNISGTSGTFTNQSSGTVDLTGGNFTGINVFNNAGALNSTSGMGRTLGVTTFNNLSGGTINMAGNGSTSDLLTITGNYVGSAGSRIIADVDLSRLDAASSRGDRVIVNGQASGSTNLTFNFLNNNRVAFTAPIDVFTVAPGSSITVNQGEIDRRGLFGYYLRESSAGSGNYQVVSQFNSGPVSGVLSGINGVISSLQSGFHQPASAIVSRPDSCEPNQLMGGPFIRMNRGETTIEGKSLGSTSGGGGNFSGESKSKSQFSGIQGGFDLGVCNINNSGWNVNAGVMGGFVSTSSTSLSSSPSPIAGQAPTLTRVKADVDVPFFGAYSFLTNGPFTLELNIRKDLYDAKVGAFDGQTGASFVNPNTKLKGSGLNYNIQAQYRFNMDGWYIEPLVGISRGTTKFGALTFASSMSDGMVFRDSTSVLARAGVNIGTAVQLTDKLIVVPFAHASIWNELEKATRAQAVFNSVGQSFDVQTDRVGSFGQVGAGVQFRLLDSPWLGFIRADARFGNKTDGKALNAGIRAQF